MKIDLDALGRFNRLAHEGAERAAASLSQMTAIDTGVETTSLTLVSREEAGEEFGDSELAGVEIGFDGGIAGRTVIAFDRESTETLLDALPAGTNPKATVKEVGNILVGGFLDGWADYLGTAIDFSPPTYVSGTGAEVVPAGTPEWERDEMFSFASALGAGGGAVEFSILMVPDFKSFQRLVSGDESGSRGEAGSGRNESSPLPFDGLTTFNRMTRHGAGNAADNITTMTGIETDVEVSRLSFVPIERLPAYVGDERYVATVFELNGRPSGYILFLFDEQSARVVANAMIPMESEGFGEMQESAIEEIGNVMTSGFIDGWANVLNTSIEHTPPRLVHDAGRAIVDPIATDLACHQEFAFLLDSTIETGGRTTGCEILAIPDEDELTAALEDLALDSGDARGDEVVSDMSAPNYEDL